MRLEGKVAVVTGAGSGIGKAVARVFAAEGATVLAVDINPDGLRDLVADSPSIEPLEQDLRAKECGAIVVEAVRERFGRLDIVVNNAGVEGQRALSSECTDENWDLIFDINLKAAFRLARAAMPLMASGGGGAIVGMSSTIGPRGIAGVSAYASAKSGLLGLSAVLAVEGGPHNIRSNCICPGLILTPINDARPADRMKSVAERIPLGRLGEADDVARVALFLASDDSRYVTAQTIFVDGGWSMSLA